MKDSGRQKDRQRWERKEWASLVEKHPRRVKASPWGRSWEKQSRTLSVWWYAGLHQAEGLLHRTSIALSLARGLSQSDRLFPSVKKKQTNKQTRMDTNTKTRSHKRNGDYVQGSRRRSVSPSPTRRKQRKRGGKHRSGRGGQRCKMRKADRLSNRIIRV